MSIKVAFTAPGKMGIGWQPTAEGLVVGLISRECPVRAQIAIGCLLVGINDETVEELGLTGTTTQGLVERMAQRPVTLVLDPPTMSMETHGAAGQGRDSADAVETSSASPNLAGTGPWPLNHPLAGMAYNHEARRWETLAAPESASQFGAPTAGDQQRKRAKTAPASDTTGTTAYKRPQGRAPAGHSWNASTGYWEAPNGSCIETKAVRHRRAMEKGKHKQPQGRPRKGQTWNYDTGAWEKNVEPVKGSPESVKTDSKGSTQTDGNHETAASEGSPSSTEQSPKAISGDQTVVGNKTANQKGSNGRLPSAQKTQQVLPAWIRETQAEVKHFMTEHRVLQAEFSKKIGYSSAVVSQWLRGIYEWNNEEIGRAAQAWLQAEKAARGEVARTTTEAMAAAASPKAPGAATAKGGESDGDSSQSTTAEADAAPIDCDNPANSARAEGSTELRDEMLAYSQSHGVSQQEICTWVGYSSAVISLWKRGLYRGNTTEIDRVIRAWMQAHSQARKTGRPIAPGPVRKSRGDGVSSVPAQQATKESEVKMQAQQGADAAASIRGNPENEKPDDLLASNNDNNTKSDAADEKDVDDDTEKKPAKRKRRSFTKFMRWGSAEEQALQKLMDEDDDAQKIPSWWTEKANQLGTGRSGSAVHQHWLIMQGKSGSTKAETAEAKQTEQQQQSTVEPSQSVDNGDRSLPASRPVSPPSTSSSSATAKSTDDESSSSGTKADAASAGSSACGEANESDHADCGNASGAGHPQPKRQKSVNQVDRFYQLAASRRPSGLSSTPANVPADPV